MQKYKVLDIAEDLDFGCEELPENAPVMAVVTLEDEEGNISTKKIPDRELYEQGIREGDFLEL